MAFVIGGVLGVAAAEHVVDGRNHSTTPDSPRARPDAASDALRITKAPGDPFHGTTLARTEDDPVEDLRAEVARLTRLNHAAMSKGFLETLDVPNLTGTVTAVSEHLCTIQISENPDGATIEEVLDRGSFRFSISEGADRRAEAWATKYEPSAETVLCRLVPRPGSTGVREGDLASTRPARP